MQNSPLRFIVIGNARSGTTYLQSLIDSHPQIKCYGEIFHLLSLQPDVLRKVVHDPISYVYNHIYQPNHKVFRAIGYKMVYTQIGANNLFLYDMNTDYVSGKTKNRRNRFSSYMKENFHLEKIRKHFDSFQEYIKKDRELKVIHISRHNKLEMYLSFRLAGISEVWNSLKGEYLSIQLYLDPIDCAEYFRKVSSLENLYIEVFKDHEVLHLNYDNLFNDPNSYSDNIQDFLEVDRHILSSPLKKQNTKNLKDWIENFDELKDFFINTEWQHFF